MLSAYPGSLEKQEKLYSYSCRCYHVGSVWLGGIEHFIPLRFTKPWTKIVGFPGVFFVIRTKTLGTSPFGKDF